MMKMHGLGDFAYYSVQYCWFLSLYMVYIAVLIIMGSAVNIGFFRQNSYILQIVSAAVCSLFLLGVVNPTPIRL